MTNAADRKEKPDHIAWAIAIVIGLCFGIPVATSTNRSYVRKAIRGERIEPEPTVSRETWCPTPEQRASVPVREPLLIAPPDQVAAGQVQEPALDISEDTELVGISIVEAEINRRILGRLERIRSTLEVKPHQARAELGLLIAELRARNEVKP